MINIRLGLAFILLIIGFSWLTSCGSAQFGNYDRDLDRNNKWDEKHVHGKEWFEPCSTADGVSFKSGFDDVDSLAAMTNGQQLGIRAKFARPSCQSDAKQRRHSRFSLGRALIQFQGGDTNERRAEVASDPDNNHNKVMAFVLNRPNVSNGKIKAYKGRVQMNVYDNTNVKIMKVSVRMYLHPDFRLTQSYDDEIDWLAVSEWWNNANWTNEKFPFRISVNLTRPKSNLGEPFHFRVNAQTYDDKQDRWGEPLWTETGASFPVPIGKWITLNYEFKEGDAKTGKFSLSVQTDHGQPITVFDVRNYTHHPDDPHPDGLSHVNPIKLYTSRKLIEHVRSKGGALQIYWDDLDLQAFDN